MMEKYFVVYNNGHVLQVRGEKACKEHIAKHLEATQSSPHDVFPAITHVIKGKSMSWQTEVQVFVSLNEEEE